MDSIRENRTKEDIIQEILMEINEDIEDKKCFILVEGNNDIVFWRGILSEHVICVESFSGKQGLEELIEEERLNFANIIMVRDRDYLDVSSLQDRRFVYDHCALELMLLSNNVVSDSLYRVYYKGNRNNHILHAMKQLAPYSILRRKNELHSLKIGFSGIGIGDQIINDEFHVKEVFKRLQCYERYYDDCKAEAVKLTDADLWDITNGHDICIYLGKCLQNGKKKLGETGVRNALFVIYRREDFEKTDLYDKMRKYEQMHGLKFFG